ncbi:hypothetical protein V5799_012386 [Amblyomma americanum]|uniref:Secreted protein n=1 Tax=Amblyomma americanum TaxID=6943 RepID=A0AAQ4EE89_AMBAM
MVHHLRWSFLLSTLSLFLLQEQQRKKYCGVAWHETALFLPSLMACFFFSFPNNDSLIRKKLARSAQTRSAC